MPCAVSGVCLSRRTQLILFFISLGVCLKAFIRGKAHERPLAARLMLEFLEAMAGNVAAREVDFRRARWREGPSARRGQGIRCGTGGRQCRGEHAVSTQQQQQQLCCCSFSSIQVCKRSSCSGVHRGFGLVCACEEARARACVTHDHTLRNRWHVCDPANIAPARITVAAQPHGPRANGLPRSLFPLEPGPGQCLAGRKQRRL